MSIIGTDRFSILGLRLMTYTLQQIVIHVCRKIKKIDLHAMNIRLRKKKIISFDFQVFSYYECSAFFIINLGVEEEYCFLLEDRQT